MTGIPHLPAPSDGWVPLSSRQAFVFVRNAEFRRFDLWIGDVEAPAIATH